MAIVMLQETHDQAFTTEVLKIKTDMFGHSAEAPVIFHRRDMVRGEPPFERLKADPFFAMEFETRWTDLVEKSAYLAMACAIDKDEHIKKYVVWQHDPYHYCLEMLLERFVKWLKRHKFCGDVVVESRDKYADKRLKAAYRRFYDSGNLAVTAEMAQEVLTSKELKFARKSDDIAGHQLADSLAHPILRYMKTENLNEPPATGFGARLVDILKATKLARKPRTDLIQGWGLKWLP
ncbi:hypothetical protein HNP60_003835 [Sphingobium sp. B1D3A]|uniref:Uncharacterized protein n=2 Tax=Sphingobium lignivorans TaxID=2735886 RepID=A0ABR6NL58_9SPHN|nr:hypothetical protein [Sphingobium lignivorans]